MAFLTVAGITISVAPTGASTKAREVGGSDSRAYAGNLRSTVRWEKRQWSFTSKPLPDATAAAVEAAVANGAFVACSGDALGGATVSCRVTLGDGPMVKVAGGFRRTLALALREV